MLRHAETSAPDRFHGAESDVGLSDRGRAQADLVANALALQRPEAVYSSAMRRALDTAAPIARACGLIPLVEPRLHERRMGPLSGLSREQGHGAYAEAKRRWAAGDVAYSHEGGESFEAIRDRVVPILERVARAHRGGTAVVVAHGVVIRVLLCSLLDGDGAASFEQFAIDNVGVNDLRWDGSRWHAVELNRRFVQPGETFAW